MKCVERFELIYKKEPENISFCPYRICPLGAHVDHQLGRITGLAIDKGIHIAYGPKKNGVVEMSSLQFEKCAQWHVNQVPEVKENDWADYLRGATWALGQKYQLNVGLCGVIEGSLPIGGLSSSAAVIISFLAALCKVNNIQISQKELVMTALSAENNYVGVSCGKLDQSCEVYSKKDHLLYLDTKDDSYELIPAHPDMKPYKIAIFFSGVERTLAGSKYNMRVDECKSAAYALKAYAGMEYGKFNETVLRDVPYEVYLQYKDRLPENWAEGREKITVVDDGTSSNETRLGAVNDIQFAIDKLELDDEMLVIAGDNLLDFSLTAFMKYAKEKNASCIMRYYEPEETRLHKSGVVTIDENDKILSMVEKPAEPKSHWCCPPFYYYTRDDAKLIQRGIDTGCGTDAPGSYIAWLSAQVPVYAMKMPGRRYDIGNMESYKAVQKEYQGIER